MAYCPWCSEEQDWGAGPFEGVCPSCNGGVGDWMPWCPWCGKDAAGGDRLRPALERVERLIAAVGLGDWGYRVLLRPGVSGVDPEHPRIVEINRGLVLRRPMDQSEWDTLVGLIIHELGHSYLYHQLAWGRSVAFRQAFGDVDLPYDVPDTVDVEFGKPRFSRTPSGHASHYGQSHPQEDFAETFRYYVLRGGQLADLLSEARRTGKVEQVGERFRLLDAFVRAARFG